MRLKYDVRSDSESNDNEKLWVGITSHTYSSNRGVKTLLIVKCERKNRMKSIYKAILGGTLRKRDLT